MRFMTSLKFIDVVAREGSIRKAADKLAITSTALNRRILQIEDEIGQPLFERLPGGVRLNTAGEIFVQHIRLQFADGRLRRGGHEQDELLVAQQDAYSIF